MTKLAYLECPTGIAGDMCLGALVHAGVPLSYLTEQLNLLEISQEYQLRVESVTRNGQQATKVHVDLKKTVVSLRADQKLARTAAECSTDAEATVTTEIAIAVESEAVNTSNGVSASVSEQATDHAHPPEEAGHPHQNHHHHHHDPSDHEHHHATSQTAHDEVRHHHNRTLPDIEALIQAADLPHRVKVWSLAIFRTLAIAEGAVHGIPPEQVHFHEVGATDAIVDIVGTCLGLDWLGVEGLYCSALPTGGGTVRAAHGRLPVPVPAVMKLWEHRQVPIYYNGIDRELVTPTGAAIVVTLADRFGPPPPMLLQKVGLGAGSRDLPIPNILRLWLGNAITRNWQDLRQQLEIPGSTTPQASKLAWDNADQISNPLLPLSSTFAVDESWVPHTNGATKETIAVLETQVDDLNPQAIGYLFDALFSVGALDVFTQAVSMKKSRPGTLITVLCRPDLIPQCETVLFRETTTLGVRQATQQRTALQRNSQTVQTHYGPVQVKIAWVKDPKEILNVQPEYEDCARLARQYDLPWREVHNLALRTWYEQRDLQLATP